MPTTLDCELLRDLFGSAAVRACFDSRALLQGWLDAERALAEAQADVGVVPREAARRIARECDASLYDLDALREGIAESQHPLVPLVRALASRCGEAGGWVHWGATTQDIVDTGAVLQVRRALGPVLADLDAACAAAGVLAAGHRETPQAGRTHGQHAVPITFGLKAASWADELLDAREELVRAAERAARASLAGAAGTLASLGADADAVRRAFAARLELGEADVPWHAARGRVRALAAALGEVGAVAERVAAEVVRLQSTEVAEAAEPLAPGHVGSSTMPQKQNPMVCEYVVASARLQRAAVSAVLGAGAHWGERDMALWAVEWIALPQALVLTGGMLEKLRHVLEGLQVDPRRMRANLGLTRGAIMAEAAMMAAGATLGHERAHQLVAAAAKRAAARDGGLDEALGADDELAAALPEGLPEPDAYLGGAAAAADAAAERARRELP